MSDDWKEQKKRQKAIFTTQQNLPYEVKVSHPWKIKVLSKYISSLE